MTASERRRRTIATLTGLRELADKSGIELIDAIALIGADTRATNSTAFLEMLRQNGERILASGGEGLEIVERSPKIWEQLNDVWRLMTGKCQMLD